MIIVDIFIFIIAVSIALACLYMACIMIAFVLHKFCNMILLVAQKSARDIVRAFMPKITTFKI